MRAAEIKLSAARAEKPAGKLALRLHSAALPASVCHLEHTPLLSSHSSSSLLDSKRWLLPWKLERDFAGLLAIKND